MRQRIDTTAGERFDRTRKQFRLVSVEEAVSLITMYSGSSRASIEALVNKEIAAQRRVGQNLRAHGLIENHPQP